MGPTKPLLFAKLKSIFNFQNFEFKISNLYFNFTSKIFKCQEKNCGKLSHTDQHGFGTDKNGLHADQFGFKTDRNGLYM